MATLFENFTNKYSLSKTLRFELKPVGKTLEHIEKKGLLSEDKTRAEDYQFMKKLIDEFHKDFISKALNNKSLSLSQLEDFQEQYLKKKDKDIKQFKKTADTLRKEVVGLFKNHTTIILENNKPISVHPFKALFEADLIKKHLGYWINKDGKTKAIDLFDKLNPHKKDLEEMEKYNFFSKMIEKFGRWTSYFGGFHQNRENMYSDKEQSTAISFRIIHQNLPKFIDNIQVFKLIQNKVSPVILQDWEEKLQRFLFGPLSDIFEIQYFNNCLSQEQIDSYNRILGGETEEILENGKVKELKKHQGLNELINLYNQQIKDKKDRLPKLTILYKQILSDRVGTSFVAEKFKDAKELKETLLAFDEHVFSTQEPRNQGKSLWDEILEFYKKINSETNWNQIYIRNTALSEVSGGMFGGGNFGLLKEAMRYAFLKNKDQNNITSKNSKGKKVNLEEKLQKELDSYLKKSYFTVSEVENALRMYLEETDCDEKFKKLTNRNHIMAFFLQSFEVDKKGEKHHLINHLLESRVKVLPVLQNESSTLEKDEVELLKSYLDAFLVFLHFIKLLEIAEKDKLHYGERNSDFYHDLDQFLMELNKPMTLLYDKVRNFVTQKPYSVEKYKLNFENVSLLAGWDVNKEKDNSSVILRKKELYYLAIMDKNNTNVFEKLPQKTGQDFYEKMFYKYYPDASKMIPKCSTQLKDVVSHFLKSKDDFILHSESFTNSLQISKEIFDLNNKGYDPEKQEFVKLAIENDEGEKEKLKFVKKFQKDYERLTGDSIGFKTALTQWIDFCKSFLAVYKSTSEYEYHFRASKDYDSLDQFYLDIDISSYSLTFKELDSSYVENLVEKGQVYLFQIYNKDFSQFSKGKPNMHTMYWKALFEPESLKKLAYKLNGEAEVFHRKGSIQSTITHPKNKPILNKNSQNKKKESIFNYDLIKDKRFTSDSFYFHVPITLNFKKSVKGFNESVLQSINSEPEENIRIIGIDRGERHLLYYSVIDSKGIIIEQGSLNEIKNEYQNADGEMIPVEFNYQVALDKKEKERAESRESWKAIGNIKELKEGYLSQVVHKISKLMIKHNAFVVLEDLNFGFKRGRFKVEKQVYQKFEKALIDKLNFLVFKDVDIHEKGGLLQAYQFTEKFETFKDMGKQTGFLFYVPAANTSKIDFKTGFINQIHPKFESIDQAKKLLEEKLESIRFNSEKDYFEFKTKGENPWIICSNGHERHYFDAKTQCYKSIQVSQELRKLFQDEKIDTEFDKNCLPQILEAKSKNLFYHLMYLLKILLQIRYNDGELDYILSPIADKNGNFFDSRKAQKDEPQDPDANGAYHIALKGLLLLQRMNGKLVKNDKKSKNDAQIDLSISNFEWMDFVRELKIT